MRERKLESSDTVYVILKMLISCRITSGVPNKCSTQLIFDGVDLTMLRAKEVVITYCRECIGSRLRKNISDHSRW